MNRETNIATCDPFQLRSQETKSMMLRTTPERIPRAAACSSHRHLPSARLRTLTLEPLEERRLLAVTILEETFKSLDYTIAGEFSGSTEIPGYGYQDAYTGTTLDAGTMTYTSPTNGAGPITISGEGSGNDNYQCPSYSFEFEGHGTLMDEDGTLSRFDVDFDRFDYVGCPGAEPIQFDRDLYGAFDTSDFSAALSWTVDVDGGTSTGNWSGELSFQGDPFDIQPTELSFLDPTSLEVAFEVTGQPSHTPTHLTPVANLELYWANGSTTDDIVGAAIDTVIPIYWNQASGRARVTEVPPAPVGSTHLLLVADRTNEVTEAAEDNNVLAWSTDIDLTQVSWNIGRDVNPTERGMDFEYSVLGADLQAEPTMHFYWAEGPELENQLAELPWSVTLQASAGDHLFNEPGRWFGTPPGGTTHILAVVDQYDFITEAREDNNLLALPLHSAEEILMDAIVLGEAVYDGTNPRITASFQPGNGAYTMSEAEIALGVDHFNWIQFNNATSDNWTVQGRTLDNADALATLPILDPTSQEGWKELLINAPHGAQGYVVDTAPDEAIFYWDELDEVRARTTSYSLSYEDAPRFPDTLLAGGFFWEYETTLVGVGGAGELIPLPVESNVKNTMVWYTDAVFDAGGLSAGVPIWLKAIDDGSLPVVTSGGVRNVYFSDNVYPVAFSDRVAVPEGTTTSIDVLANDIHPYGLFLLDDVNIVTQPAHGTVSVDSNTEQILYTAPSDYIGTVTVEYTVDDRFGNESNVAQLEIRTESSLGVSRHSFTATVTGVGGADYVNEIEVGTTISGTFVYDTNAPFQSVNYGSDYELTTEIGEISFPPTDGMTVTGPVPGQADLLFSYVQSLANTDISVEASFQLNGPWQAQRMPKRLDDLTDGLLRVEGSRHAGPLPMVEFVVQATINEIVFEAGPPWQNPNVAENVDTLNGVTPTDVLLIINRLNREERIFQLPDPPQEPDVPPPYYDVNGDGWLSPNDALLVINWLYRNGLGEGEPVAASRDPLKSPVSAPLVDQGITSAIPRLSSLPGAEFPTDEQFDSWLVDQPPARKELDAALIEYLTQQGLPPNALVWEAVADVVREHRGQDWSELPWDILLDDLFDDL
jgi:hypothetical protein